MLRIRARWVLKPTTMRMVSLFNKVIFLRRFSFNFSKSFKRECFSNNNKSSFSSNNRWLMPET